jgi:four helix bundle protein
MQDFRQLKVWEKAHALTLNIYQSTKNYPREELFGLTSQMRRACASIPANLAEGSAKNTDADFARYVQIAIGSASELEYHLLLSKDLGYLKAQEHFHLSDAVVEIRRMLISLASTLRNS